MKETLEEAAEDYAEANKFISDRPFEFARDKNAFIAGAKWQQEQDRNVYLNGYVDGSREQAKLMYSEEEVILIIEKFRDLKMIAFSEWFERFKKK